MEIALFAYGTLKRGFSAHRRLCPRLRAVQPARVKGRLFSHRAGYPVLVVPRTAVIAVAGGDPDTDAALEREAAQGVRNLQRVSALGTLAEVSGPWRWIHGELLRFEAGSFARFDAYEDFEPGRSSPFVRVLVRVWPVAGLPCLAWTYVAGRGGSIGALAPLVGGRWPEDRR